MPRSESELNETSTGRSFVDLAVWQAAMELAKEVYRATSEFPVEERFGLTAQMRRAAVSIPSNIAEGQGRRTRGEFLQFLGTARGSLYELRTQLTLSRDLGFLAEAHEVTLKGHVVKTGQLLNGLIRSLSR